MATSRTGESKWINTRARLIRTRVHACHWCGVVLEASAPKGTPDSIEMDHVMPVTRGGDDSDDNLTLACHPCNRRKSNNVAPGAPRSGYDINGMLILDPRVTCKVHPVIKASCPHSGSLI